MLSKHGDHNAGEALQGRRALGLLVGLCRRWRGSKTLGFPHRVFSARHKEALPYHVRNELTELELSIPDTSSSAAYYFDILSCFVAPTIPALVVAFGAADAFQQGDVPRNGSLCETAQEALLF